MTEDLELVIRTTYYFLHTTVSEAVNTEKE